MGAVCITVSHPSGCVPIAIQAQAVIWPNSKAAEKSTISWYISLRFLAMVPSMIQSISFLKGLNISPKWANRKNLNKFIVGFCYIVIIEGIVARTSNMKKPFKYDIEIVLKVRLLGVATMKLSKISIHQEMSLTQTSHIIFSYMLASSSIISNTIFKGVSTTVIQVII